MKIVVLDGYAANPGDLSWDGLRELGELTVYERTAPEEVLERAKGAQVITTNKVLITEELMDRLPELRYIGVLATGYNVVDVPAACKRGIIVTNIPAYSTMSVAQMAIAHLLNICNQVALHSEAVKRGDWQLCKDFTFTLTPLIELDGKTFGIVGMGNTGMATARIAQSLGMRVMAFSSKSRELLSEMGIERAKSYDHLFHEADVISLHCPLTEETHHIVNAERLQLMKPTAILINTGRGPLVDEHALALALNEGRIMAAGVDVLEEEPPRDGSPLIGARNCYITPHVAWATRAARTRLMNIAVENVKAYIKGKPQNVVH
ncbi:MAG: D-2-hydroxyacid dehydrogenase [Bacteroidaceae bacterium]|nr:D-2-hydroxyacid dehydrogenase [Bacteroidaceae bacterium]